MKVKIIATVQYLNKKVATWLLCQALDRIGSQIDNLPRHTWQYLVAHQRATAQRLNNTKLYNISFRTSEGISWPSVATIKMFSQVPNE